MGLSRYCNPIEGRHVHAMRLASEVSYPREACGFLLEDGRMVELENRSPNDNEFIISAEDYARHDEQIAAVWHTHNQMAGFSPADIQSCKQLHVPFMVFDRTTGLSFWLDPRQSAGLLGRPWNYGIHDCYGAVRDWYYQQCGVVLGDYPRTKEGEWANPDFNYFEENWEREGFRKVGLDEVQRGDMLMFRIRNDHTCNHVAVVEDAGAGHLFQHLVGRFSEIGVYSNWLRQTTVHALRHESCDS